jgi:prefoldin beta subunit
MVPERYTELVNDINANREKLQVQYDLLKQLTSQKSENESVKKEFEILEPTGVIWKLVGPIMVKQDREDATANVEKRIEFISADIMKAEDAIKSLEDDFETKRGELMKLQESLQATKA